MPALTISDILELSVKERIQFVEDVWDSIATSPDALPLTVTQRDELDRRLDALQQHPNAYSTWGEVKKRLNQPE